MFDRRRISIQSLTAGGDDNGVVANMEKENILEPHATNTVTRFHSIGVGKKAVAPTNLVTGYTNGHQVQLVAITDEVAHLHLIPPQPSVPSLKTILPDLLQTVRPRTNSVIAPHHGPMMMMNRPLVKRASMTDVPLYARRSSLAISNLTTSQYPTATQYPLVYQPVPLYRRQSTASSSNTSSNMASDSDDDNDDTLDEQTLGSMPAQEQLKYSHKLAERKRRREMKLVFDALRCELPGGAEQRLSKWEILSKTCDFIDRMEARRISLSHKP